jgi:hypothetical protein
MLRGGLEDTSKKVEVFPRSKKALRKTMQLNPIMKGVFPPFWHPSLSPTNSLSLASELPRNS